MKVVSLGILSSITLTLWAGGAVSGGPPPVVEARMVLATKGVHPGSLAKVAVIAKISSGYHVNEHHPSLDYLIPSELKLDPPAGITVERAVYPPGRLEKFAFSDTSLSVYEGTVVVGALLKVAPSVRHGTLTLAGKFSYQACDDQACLPPTSVPVSVALQIVGRKVPLEPIHSEIFSKLHLD